MTLEFWSCLFKYIESLSDQTNFCFLLSVVKFDPGRIFYFRDKTSTHLQVAQ
jgi:hypothetical protein